LGSENKVTNPFPIVLVVAETTSFTVFLLSYYLVLINYFDFAIYLC